MAPAMPPPGKIKQLTIDIELSLHFSSITDTDRQCAPISLQFLDVYFLQASLPANPEKNLKFSGTARRASFDEAAKTIGLGDKPEFRQRPYGKT